MHDSNLPRKLLNKRVRNSIETKSDSKLVITKINHSHHLDNKNKGFMMIEIENMYIRNQPQLSIVCVLPKPYTQFILLLPNSLPNPCLPINIKPHHLFT